MSLRYTVLSPQCVLWIICYKTATVNCFTFSITETCTFKLMFSQVQCPEFGAERFQMIGNTLDRTGLRELAPQVFKMHLA
jgi:hypothetical protein